ncbi:MAG TPA: hypothetical protein VF100_02985 [Thermoanaerobaculia bacterium]
MRGAEREVLRLLRGRLPSADELESIRLRRLRALLAWAGERVPYYADLFARAGFDPASVRAVDDLRRVPISTRDQLVEAGERGLARGFDPARAVHARTSGSSGRPWTTLRSRRDERLRRALELRSMRRAGIGAGDTIATLGPLRERPLGTLGRLGLYRTVQVSPLLPVDEQIRRLREIHPDVLWAYPSALRTLVRQTGSLAAVVRPRLLVTAAEPLDDVLRRQLTAEGDLQIRNFYGAVECGRIAWECAAGEGLHLNADCMVLELAEDVEVEGAGRSVVITNLLSSAMPIIRYRLGDLAELVGRPCSCGAALPLMRPPVGREWDALELPSGRLLSTWGFNIFLRDLEGLRQFRVVQSALDRVVLQLRFAAPPPPARLAALRDRVARHLGEPMRVDVEQVAAFEEGPLKFRTFISEVRGVAGS